MGQTETDRDHSTPGYFNQCFFPSFSIISFIIPMELGRHKGNVLFGNFRYWRIFTIFDPTFSSVNAKLELELELELEVEEQQNSQQSRVRNISS